MINLPYVTMPDTMVRLLSGNIQNTPHTNNQLEAFFSEHRELNLLIKRSFKDIDPEEFVGKIISIVGFTGIRNRLCALMIEHASRGIFPTEANLSLVTEILNLENKLRHFTVTGYSRAFLLGLYAKLSLIKINHMEEVHQYSPLIIKDEHLELLKYSKSKSIKIDWLILQIVLFESVFGIARLETMLKSQMKFNAIFNMLNETEKSAFMENMLTYGSSILDYDFFLVDSSMVKE